MKIRLCNKCKKEINGAFIKCCKAETINKKYTLNYMGDLCFSCWATLEIPNEPIKSKSL